MNYKELIESKGIKKSFIASRMGVSSQFLSQCLSGKKKFPKNRLEVLHKILHIN